MHPILAPFFSVSLPLEIDFFQELYYDKLKVILSISPSNFQ
jgi:hypothetical protein